MQHTYVTLHDIVHINTALPIYTAEILAAWVDKKLKKLISSLATTFIKSCHLY